MVAAYVDQNYSVWHECFNIIVVNLALAISDMVGFQFGFVDNR